MLEKERIEFGILPKRRSIYINPSKTVTEETELTLYRLTLEASLNDSDIILTNPRTGAFNAIKSGIIDGRGILHLVLPYNGKESNRRYISFALATGGSAILIDSPTITDLSYTQAEYIALSMATAFILASDYPSSRRFPPFTTALDLGLDVGIIPSVMNNKSNRNLLRDGATPVFSYLSVFPSARVIVYPDSRGKYSFKEKRFSSLNFHCYEK